MRRTPGRDSTLERRSPEVKTEAVFRSKLPLGHLLASARPVPSGLRFPGTNLRRAEQLRCHATTHAMPNLMSASTRSQHSSSRLLHVRGPRLIAPAGCRVCPFRFGTEGHLAFHDVFSPGGEEGRLGLHLSSCITREHHLASRLDPRGVHFALGQVRSELAFASGSEGFSLFADRRSPERLLPLGSRLRAEIVGSSPSTSMVAPTWLAVRKIP